MPLIAFNLRDLRTGERMLSEFETLDSCERWLKARPQFIRVLGPTTEGISTQIDQRLREAVRPFDAEEQQLIDAQRAEQQRLHEANEAEVARELEAAQAAHESKLANLPPGAPMELRWTPDGVTHADERDTRDISLDAIAAVEAWVKERNTWIHRRGQQVGEALVTVWPGVLPAGEEERVHPGGQFVPIAL